MDILVIGSGGREHALVYGLRHSASVGRIYALPGNGGINEDAEEVNIAVDDFEAIAAFCLSKEIALIVVGPEAPLVDGIVDFLEKRNIKTFGPSARAARIEASKTFMKDIAGKYGVPTAGYGTFTDVLAAKNYVREKGVPIVIKADGLAAGKGVVIAVTEEEALYAVDEMLAGKFGDAGLKIIIEEYLTGEEVSFFAICDGKTAVSFGSAQDHKAVGEGGRGPNTGGMGAYSPAAVITAKLHDRIMNEIILPVVSGMKKDGNPYKGLLFAGLMIDGEGNPKLLEFNVRFGDPESQVLIPRLKSDLSAILLAACDGQLEGYNVEFSDQTALCVVMAAKGYPSNYSKGTAINGVELAEAMENVVVFHAGTKYAGKQLVSAGGRVLGITALAGNVISAQSKAYRAVDAIDWQDGFCRRDIGWRAVERFKLAS